MATEIMTRLYILDSEGNPQPCDSSIPNPLQVWGRWHESSNRRVALTKISPAVTVSTVFLGIDQRLEADGPPLLWETMIFGGEHDQYQERYVSRAEALEGHESAVEMIKDEEETPTEETKPVVEEKR